MFSLNNKKLHHDAGRTTNRKSRCFVIEHMSIYSHGKIYHPPIEPPIEPPRIIQSELKSTPESI